ncbi:hypothetical protein [Rhodothermus profundi]|uniref:Protein FliT n=1 Tax=Rhodothermus profundi TaxID=633813 RepID=A0A1M6X7L9_9BACT|nr:hypothetical protein [Rhodothermus profundi]SHL01987.1 hypothetical protein SAMN04488087_2536 [Rhodothermus profundi]
MSAPDTLSLLREILDLGEAIERTLINQAFEQLHELVKQRGTLIDQLRQHEPPSDFDPEWEVLRVALTAQHRRLQELMAETERQLTRSLVALEQYKQARQSYQDETPPRRSVLRAGLQG